LILSQVREILLRVMVTLAKRRKEKKDVNKRTFEKLPK
jgi:hypothetical protein